MKYREIVKRSIISFMDGNMPQETANRKETGLMYTPDYFDQLEEDILGKESKKQAVNDKEGKDEA